MNKVTFGSIAALALTFVVTIACQMPVTSTAAATAETRNPAALDIPESDTVKRIVKSDAEWKKLLPAERYNILREKGTERAYSGLYWNNHEKGTFHCAACNLPLFNSTTKFESGTGWPSFYAPFNATNVSEESDQSYGMVRTEVNCARCGGHLGHVFDDGPKPTGKRYCINSLSIVLVKK